MAFILTNRVIVTAEIYIGQFEPENYGYGFLQLVCWNYSTVKVQQAKKNPLCALDNEKKKYDIVMR